MATRMIREFGDAVLRKHSKPVKEMTPRLRGIIEDMLETMYEAGGVGLAGPQVGILKRVVDVYKRQIRDIHKGLDPTGGKAMDIPDRREAIRYSIANAQDGDVIAVIGKGHEDYQEVEGVRTHFLDREVIEETVRELGLRP